jgi:hypothetical protein
MKCDLHSIIPVNPWELSLHGRDFYSEMDASAAKRNTNEYPQFSTALNFGGIIFFLNN